MTSEIQDALREQARLAGIVDASLVLDLPAFAEARDTIKSVQRGHSAGVLTVFRIAQSEIG